LAQVKPHARKLTSGFYENPRPDYDVFYFLDLSPEYADAFGYEFHRMFAEGAGMPRSLPQRHLLIYSRNNLAKNLQKNQKC
jgi:hypothetical protein